MNRRPRLDELPSPPPGRSGWPWTEASLVLPETMPDGRPWPRITLVTPSLNQGQFIEETIRSVLLQGYPDLEYIVMDGGSGDGSVEIIRRYAPWLAGWVSAPDGGQAAAINQGWRLGSGEAVTWLNADDLLLPGSLARSAAALYAPGDASLAYGHACRIDEHSSPIPLMQIAQPFVPEEIIVKGAHEVIQPGFLAKRTAIEDVGWLDESLHLSMDQDLWVRLALADARGVYLNEVLACLRIHKDSKTSTLYRTRIADRERIYEKTFPSGATRYLPRSQEARLYVLLRAMGAAYGANDLALARVYRGRAWRHVLGHGSRLSWRAVALLALSLTGGSGLRWAKRLWLTLCQIGVRRMR